jgi:hypothetical protein
MPQLGLGIGFGGKGIGDLLLNVAFLNHELTKDDTELLNLFLG